MSTHWKSGVFILLDHVLRIFWCNCLNCEAALTMDRIKVMDVASVTSL